MSNPRDSAGGYSYSINVSPEVDALLGEMAHASGGSKGDVIRKAIGLYKLALDAHKEGLRVGAAKGDQEMEVEFVGLGAP